MTLAQKKQRIAIVGCGGITDHYLRIYHALDFIEAATCIDSDYSRAAAYAAGFVKNDQKNQEVRATTDFADALSADVDTVIINTPNHLHREQAVAALDAGKHVLLQKPIAANLEDAFAIAEAAIRAGEKGILSGLYMSYFDQPLMHDLRDMARAEWFGDIVHLYARLMHRGGIEWSKQGLNGTRTWRNSIAQTGGGCFIQLAVHYIHLFEWITEARIVRITAVTKNLRSAGLEGEDLASAILEFDSGALATLDMAWCTSGEQLSIHGTRGTAQYIGNRTLLLDSDAGVWHGRVINYESETANLSPPAPGVSLGEQSSVMIAPALDDINNEFNQQKLFLEAVQNGGKPFVSIASGIADLQVIAAAYESAATKSAVEIDRRQPIDLQTNAVISKTGNI